MGRHVELTKRVANPLKRSRAAVSREEVKEFLDRWAKTIDGVPPENIWNFDETNLRDDPGNDKCLVKKGTKYVEKVMNTSMQCVSVMFCGSAAGELMNVHVNYKAKSLWETWTEKGPAGTVYTCTPSGWFDTDTCEKFFFDCALPILRRQQGKKVICCDNLSAHLSMNIMEACIKHDIAMVCFPPNSTDKLQPLDVGMFRSLKANWRTVLKGFKMKNPRTSGVDKVEFPALLKQTLRKADLGKHLPSAFAACGLVPVSLEKATSRIPHRDKELDNEIMKELMDSTLAEKLEELRGVAEKKKKPRGKRLKVPPGKSYTAPVSESEDEGDEELELDESDGEEEEAVLDSPTEMVLSEPESESEPELPDLSSLRHNRGRVQARGDTKLNLTVGAHVAAVYNAQWYIAQVEGEEEEEVGYTLLQYMTRLGSNKFIWEKKPDLLRTLDSDILMETPPPVPVSHRHFGYPRNILTEVDKCYLVVFSCPILVLVLVFV